MRKNYSLASFNRGRIPGLVERLCDFLPGYEFELSTSLVQTLRGDEGRKRIAEIARSDAEELKFFFFKGGARVSFVIREIGDLLIIWVNAEPPGTVPEDSLHEIAAIALALKEPSVDELDSTPNLYDINKRLVKVLRTLEKWSGPNRGTSEVAGKSCFVSFHFDEHGLSQAFELRDFLEAIDVTFLSGYGYEPRPISQKVLERLSSGVSLFIVLFTRDDGVGWLQQETGAAKASGIPVMVLVEDGIKYEPGMLADTEYVKFPRSAISKTFISIVQALKHVRKSE